MSLEINQHVKPSPGQSVKGPQTSLTFTRPAGGWLHTVNPELAYELLPSTFLLPSLPLQSTPVLREGKLHLSLTQAKLGLVRRGKVISAIPKLCEGL